MADDKRTKDETLRSYMQQDGKAFSSAAEQLGSVAESALKETGVSSKIAKESEEAYEIAKKEVEEESVRDDKASQKQAAQIGDIYGSSEKKHDMPNEESTIEYGKMTQEESEK